jgi:hypothetical protein
MAPADLLQAFVVAYSNENATPRFFWKNMLDGVIEVKG